MTTNDIKQITKIDKLYYGSTEFAEVQNITAQSIFTIKLLK